MDRVELARPNATPGRASGTRLASHAVSAGSSAPAWQTPCSRSGWAARTGGPRGMARCGLEFPAALRIGGLADSTPLLRADRLGLMLALVMSSAGNKTTPPPHGGSIASSNHIPTRHSRQANRRANIPPQPSIKRHTLRLALATAIGLVVMLALLMLAVKYAQRDWNQKNQFARTGLGRPATKPPAASAGPEVSVGWTHILSRQAGLRHVKRLSADPVVANWWLVMGRGLSGREHPEMVLGSLRMAMALQGENALLKNDMGAAYLQQRRMRQAAGQFQAALQIEPGFAPALFNMALCTVAQRQPARAMQLLGGYLARRPDDTGAYRLQSTLLSQLGQSREALDLLEKFLRHQPPEQPLFLDASVLAARLGQNGKALRYLETALSGNSIQSVVRAYQSSAFRTIRLSGEGDALAARMANRARVAFGAPLPVDELQPLRATPDAILR